MEANTTGSTRILQCAEDAKSPQRILIRSLLKSRNRLRAKYRELRAECKRWRNQAAAVERSRGQWRQRAEAAEASAERERAERAALESQLRQLRGPAPQCLAESADERAQATVPGGAEKRGR